jgi:hypothetical protein
VQVSGGDVLFITDRASVQFRRPILFRVIREEPWSTPQGWVWLDGYELNKTCDAVSRRSIFVQRAGLIRPRQNSAPARLLNSYKPPRL